MGILLIHPEEFICNYHTIQAGARTHYAYLSDEARARIQASVEKSAGC